MKKFTLLAFAALFTFAASAQKAIMPQKSLPNSLLEQRFGQQGGFDSQVMKRNGSAKKLANVRTLTATGNGMNRVDGEMEMITETPEGNEVIYSKECPSFYYFYDFYVTDVSNAVGRVVYGDDNTVYMKNPFGSFTTGSWIKGTIEGNIVTFTFPQLIYSQEYYGDVYNYYINRMVYDGTDDEWTYVVDETSNEIKFELRNDSLVWADVAGGDVIYGITSADGSWQGYGDYDIVLAPFTDNAVVVPAGVQMDEWGMIAGGEGTLVNVGISGNDVYLGGLLPSIPDAFIKGTIEGDKVVFEAGQYLGADDETGYHAYFLTAGANQVWDEYYGQSFSEYYLTDKIELTYDAENRTMTADSQNDSTMLVNAGKEEYSGIYSYDAPFIKYQGSLEGAVTPATPEITYFYPYDSYYGLGYFSFNIPNFDVNGNVLATSKLHYNMFVDDEIFTFYPDEYTALGDEMTDIPYDFTENWDIYAYGVTHYIYYYFTGFDKIGIRSTYTADNGETADSEIGWYYVNATGISAVTGAETGVKNVSYTDLSGRRVNAKSKGLLIKTVTYDDGTVKSYKFINR